MHLWGLQLLRDKEIISKIDLYDLLIYGKNNEINLKGGDSIVINGSIISKHIWQC